MVISKPIDTVSPPENSPRDHTSGNGKKQSGLPPDNHIRGPSVWRELSSLGIKIAVIAVAVSLVFTFIYGFHRNTDPGMSPMVKDGDLVMFYRLGKNYVIGDLLLLDYQGNRQVCRVVAKAGDMVDITKDGLIVNGSLQQELEIYEETDRYVNEVEFPVTVGAGEVFVLGDARQHATDSRVYGSVKTKDTLGKLITVIRRRNL
jgi:signal peptidase I